MLQEQAKFMMFLFSYQQEPPASAKSDSFELGSERAKNRDIYIGLNGAPDDSLGMSVEDRAALRTQTAFRAYRVS